MNADAELRTGNRQPLRSGSSAALRPPELSPLPTLQTLQAPYLRLLQVNIDQTGGFCYDMDDKERRSYVR